MEITLCVWIFSAHNWTPLSVILSDFRQAAYLSNLSFFLLFSHIWQLWESNLPAQHGAFHAVCWLSPGSLLSYLNNSNIHQVSLPPQRSDCPLQSCVCPAHRPLPYRWLLCPLGHGWLNCTACLPLMRLRLPSPGVASQKGGSCEGTGVEIGWELLFPSSGTMRVFKGCAHLG